jgi:isoleucyl-tRNA synthetase
VFAPLPEKPDHGAIERDVLERWERDRTFERLRERTAGGPRFSFVDGPVTANKTLGVHTAWGRTLKDVVQRYKALRGHELRWQNGFDCQGLWIEVGVERSLGLNSKREIEQYGLERFAAKCREVVVWSSTELTKGSIRLGMWMDWERSYFTFSDTNIEYIWRFLGTVADRGLLYQGNRPTEWCPRCGTSISAHELVGSYVDREDPSLFVRFPLRDRPGESLVVWTTTPWTLPANVAVAVHPDARYGRRPGTGDWVAVERAAAVPGGAGAELEDVRPGAELVGWRYQGPFDDLGPGQGVDHRVVAWEDVALDEGTGLVHIAPGCGAEDFELGRREGLAVLTPVDEAGRFLPEYGSLAGRSTDDARTLVPAELERRGLLVAATTIRHRYPECWRCHTPLIFRLSDDWFIAVDPLRDELRRANETVEWIPASVGKRMDDWLANMTDWNISRRRYYGMPLPFYPCGCGHLTVLRSKADLLERAVGPVGELPELRRPWIDRVTVRCEACGAPVERVKEVGDVWLDAGIVPFSTLGWQNPVRVPGGLGTGAAAGLTVADLPDHAYWEQWFPADLVSEMREQVRLWFYSQLFMSVVLTGRAPFRRVLTYEKMLDEHGQEMHGSHGNMIDADEAFERMGADVMRWLYCQQPPTQNLLFGFGPAHEVKRRLLTLWNSVAFLVQYANLVEGFTPDLADLAGEPAGLEAPLDRWLAARVRQLVHEATAGYEAYLTVEVLRALDSALEDISNWYIRRSRRRFWEGDPAALAVLWSALVTWVRLAAPVVPFLAEHLWQRLVLDPVPTAPDSVFLAGWPSLPDADQLAADRAVLAEQAAVRAVVELGRQARAESGIRVRQPLRRLVVDGAPAAAPHAGEIAEELRVKEVVFEPIEATELRVRPNLRVLGPKLGPAVAEVRAALAAGAFEVDPDGSVRVAGQHLSPEEVLVERIPREGWSFASDGQVAVALDTALDEELTLEGQVNDLVHSVNRRRKEMGLALTDRIRLVLPAAAAALLAHREWIAQETLALTVELGEVDEPSILPVAG